MSIESAIDLSELRLFDHHCHGVVESSLDRRGFEALISESSRDAPEGCTRFDTQVGFAIRRHCAPLLGLDAFASPEEYLQRRAELGSDSVNRTLLRAAGIHSYGIETGHAPDAIVESRQMADLADAEVFEIVRLERIAEEIASQIREEGASFHELLDRFSARLDEELRTAIGVKSIAAYRIGLDFDPLRPAPGEFLSAAERWLDSLGDTWPRLTDSTIIRELIWQAIDRRCAIQFHIGYGDDDVDLHRCNPLLLTGLLRETADSGARVMLLHCYPYHREAGYLADVFPHVYCDVGLAINYTGSRSATVIAESLELAPFHKILFSSDAFGAAELYLLGAVLFRRGLSKTLTQFVQLDDWPLRECRRVAEMIGHENALRAYHLDG